MNEKNRNLLVRVVSAATLFPLVVWVLVRGDVATAVLLAVASAGCAAEYFSITLKRLAPVAWVGILCAALLPLIPVLTPGAEGEVAFWVVGVFFFFAWTYHLLAGPLADAPTRVAHLVTGLLYAGIGTTALTSLRLRSEDGLTWVLVAIVVTWGNDTFAYFGGRLLGGRLFGGRKLYPEVSPNKTWEGFAGGLVGSVVCLLVLRWVLSLWQLPLDVRDCLLLGVAGGLLGPVGDLCESMLKRAHGVKDSGRLIPGHGGLLDRIDALLFNAPLVFVYVQFLRDRLPG